MDGRNAYEVHNEEAGYREEHGGSRSHDIIKDLRDLQSLLDPARQRGYNGEQTYRQPGWAVKKFLGISHTVDEGNVVQKANDIREDGR